MEVEISHACTYGGCMNAGWYEGVDGVWYVGISMRKPVSVRAINTCILL
jgi:hypothetical protein